MVIIERIEVSNVPITEMMTNIFKDLPPPENPAVESIRRTLQKLIIIDKGIVELRLRAAGIPKAYPSRPKSIRIDALDKVADQLIDLNDKRNKLLEKIKHLQKGLPPRNPPLL